MLGALPPSRGAALSLPHSGGLASSRPVGYRLTSFAGGALQVRLVKNRHGAAGLGSDGVASGRHSLVAGFSS